MVKAEHIIKILSSSVNYNKIVRASFTIDQLRLDALTELSMKTRKSRSELVREALDLLFMKYGINSK